jgi:hypothetical protein
VIVPERERLTLRHSTAEDKGPEPQDDEYSGAVMTYDVSFGRYDYQTLTDPGVGVSGPTTALNAALTKL